MGRGRPRTNSYPFRHRGRTPHPLCARSAGTTPLGRGSFFSLGRRTAPSPRRTPVHPLGRSRGAGLRSQRRARRHDPLLAIPPQRDHQLARQRHNANAAQAATAGPKPLPIPARQRAVGLPAHPGPRDFHHDPADVFETGPTNPLVVARRAALIGHRTRPLSADLAPCGRVAGEELGRQHRRSGPNPRAGAAASAPPRA